MNTIKLNVTGPSIELFETGKYVDLFLKRATGMVLTGTCSANVLVNGILIRVTSPSPMVIEDNTDVEMGFSVTCKFDQFALDQLATIENPEEVTLKQVTEFVNSIKEDVKTIFN